MATSSAVGCTLVHRSRHRHHHHHNPVVSLVMTPTQPSLPLRRLSVRVSLLFLEPALWCVDGGLECCTRLRARMPVSTPRQHRHCHFIVDLHMCHCLWSQRCSVSRVVKSATLGCTLARWFRHRDTTVTAAPLSTSTCVIVCGVSGAVCGRWPRVPRSAARSHAGLDTDTPLSLPLRRLSSRVPSVCGVSGAVCGRWTGVLQSAAHSQAGLDTDTPPSLPLRRLHSRVPSVCGASGAVCER